LFFDGPLGGEQGLTVRTPDVPAWLDDGIFFVTGQDVDAGKYLAYLSWATLIVVVVLLANLKRSQLGRTWRAVRDDPVAAQLAGINLGRVRASAFVVSAACAGAGGALMAMAVRIAAPSGFGMSLSFLLVAATVIGGLGSLPGALIGTAILTLLPQYTTDVGLNLGLNDLRAAQLAPLVQGVVMILIVLFAPSGVAGALRALRTSVPSHLRARHSSPIHE
jgi:branched-chain amino acid transport system permease protein